jgi:hypothetical protein
MGGTIALNGVFNTVGTHLLKKDKNCLLFFDAKQKKLVPKNLSRANSDVHKLFDLCTWRLNC